MPLFGLPRLVALGTLEPLGVNNTFSVLCQKELAAANH